MNQDQRDSAGSLFNRLQLPIALGLLLAATAAGGTLSKDLRNIPSASKVDVIVQFGQPPTDSDFAAVTHAGGALKRRLPIVRGALFSVPGSALQGLAANPRVFYVSPDRAVKASLEFAQPTVGANIAAQYGWT